MLTKALVVAALVAGSATVATAAEGFDPLINHETAPIITVSQRTLQSAPVRLQQDRNVRLQSAPVLQQRDVALPSADTSGAGGPFWYNGSGPTSGGM
jgi:hypothetical protein